MGFRIRMSEVGYPNICWTAALYMVHRYDVCMLRHQPRGKKNLVDFLIKNPKISQNIPKNPLKKQKQKNPKNPKSSTPFEVVIYPSSWTGGYTTSVIRILIQNSKPVRSLYIKPPDPSEISVRRILRKPHISIRENYTKKLYLKISRNDLEFPKPWLYFIGPRKTDWFDLGTR